MIELDTYKGGYKMDKKKLITEVNNLIEEFVLFFSNLPEKDFQDYIDFFIHNKIDSNISEIVNRYISLDNEYDYFATRAFLKALEIASLIKSSSRTTVPSRDFMVTFPGRFTISYARW